MVTELKRPRLKDLVNIRSIFVLALLIRWGAFYLYYFVYKTPGGIAPSPLSSDAYHVLAGELIGGRGFASWIFAYRPPLYPLFVAAVFRLTGAQEPLAAVFAQSILSALICFVTYALAGELGADEPTRKIAAALAAIDPASIAVGLGLMAETLTNIFVALSLLFLARLLKNHRLRDAAACSACIALATLTRPNALYFVAAAAAVIIWLVPRWPARIAVLAAGFAFMVLPWYARNYAYQRMFTLTTNSNFNLLFYKAVSVKQWATGTPATEIEAEFAYELDTRLGVANPPDTYDHNSMWRHLVPVDARAPGIMREMAFDVYRTYPWVYAMLIPISLVKQLAFSELIAGFGAVKWAESVFNLLLYSFALAGCIIAFKKRQWVGLSATLLPIAYYLAIPIVAGGIQDTRARTNVTICIAILAADGLIALRNKWNERR